MVTVRLIDGESGLLNISFASYTNIWGKKEVGPNITSIEEACVQLRSWLEDYLNKDPNKRGQDR